MTRATHSTRLRVAGLVLGLVVGLGAAEIALRVLDVKPTKLISKLRVVSRSDHRRFKYYCYTTNPNGEFKPTPEFDASQWRAMRQTIPEQEVPIERTRQTPWCVDMSRSPQMMRDRVFEPKAAPGVVRIAGTGDSFAQGDGVPLEKTLFKQMEAILGEGYEVINGGIGGSDTKRQADLLPVMLDMFHCDRALVVFIANDIPMSRQTQGRQKYIFDLINFRDMYLESRDRRPWYARHLRLGQLIGSRVQMNRIRDETIQWYLDMYDPRTNQAALAQLSATFRRLATMPNCRVVLVLYPLMEGLEGEYPLAPVHQRVAQMARTQGLAVIDLAPAFAGADTRSLHVHPADHHPNGKAHAIAADALVRRLRRDMPDFLTP